NMVYVFTASDSSRTEAVAEAVSASFKYGSARGSANVAILSRVQQADSNVTMNYHAFQSGAKDQAVSLRQVVGSPPGDMKSIREHLRNAVRAVTWETSRIKSFKVDQISQHFEIEDDPQFSYISDLYSDLDKAKRTADRLAERYYQLDDVITLDGTADFKIKEGQKPVLMQERDKVEKQLKELAALMRRCFRDNPAGCNVPTVDVNFKILDQLDLNFGKFSTWKASASGSYNSHDQHVYYSASFWPVFTIRNLKYINRFEFMEGESALTTLDANALSRQVNNSEMELKMQTFKKDSRRWCWKGDWSGCNAQAADNSGHKKGLKQKFSERKFHVRITDIEGNVTLLEVPLISAQTY
ncbi:MAG: hypothetical protein MK135_14005, partial [Polyangiaceae bacterium]|nr:hypothetical protein [Polyangiaceae bacterium]